MLVLLCARHNAPVGEDGREYWCDAGGHFASAVSMQPVLSAAIARALIEEFFHTEEEDTAS